MIEASRLELLKIAAQLTQDALNKGAHHPSYKSGRALDVTEVFSDCWEVVYQKYIASNEKDRS